LGLGAAHYLQHNAEVVGCQRQQLHITGDTKPLQPRSIGHLGIPAGAEYAIAQG
jgi:hypothetical protein